MASPTDGPDKDAAIPVLKRIARKLAPWYGGVISIYAPVHAVYGWLHGAGLLKTSLQDLLFNICLMAGLIALCASILGGFTAAVGYYFAFLFGMIVLEPLGFVTDADRFARRAAWIFAIMGAVAMGGFLLFAFVTDARSFTAPPKYGDGFQWFVAALGAIVIVATYALFGKKFVDQLKGIKTELEDQSRIPLRAKASRILEKDLRKQGQSLTQPSKSNKLKVCVA